MTIEENPIERIDGKAELVCSNGRRLSFDRLSYCKPKCWYSMAAVISLGTELLFAKPEVQGRGAWGSARRSHWR